MLEESVVNRIQLWYDNSSKCLFHGHMNACFFFAMNGPKLFANSAYRGIMKLYAACNTLQSGNRGSFHVAHKRLCKSPMTLAFD